MVQKIGIDAGGTFVKIAYEEKDALHFKKYPILEIESLCQWLNMIAPTSEITLTGGKSSLLRGKLKQLVTEVNEFEAMVEGSKYLLRVQEHSTDKEYILISAGTGTSIYYVNPTTFERMIGTGIGGGTFIGLGSFVTGNDNFADLVDSAKQGFREKVDLLVKDIYAPNEPPIGGELTASNFGKVHFNHNNAKPSDYMASVLQMIAESIILLATQSAHSKNVETLVFVGGIFEGNEPLRKTIEDFAKIVNKKVLFPNHGIYCGAVGALHF